MIAGTFALFFALFGQAPQELTPPPLRKTINIRMFDSRNGKPIITSKVEVWIDRDQRHVIKAHTTPNGIATVDIPAGTAGIYVTAQQNGWYLYHCDADASNSAPFYSLNEIVSSGIAAPNRCSRRTAPAYRGEITLFLRPLTWWEKFKT